MQRPGRQARGWFAVDLKRFMKLEVYEIQSAVSRSMVPSALKQKASAMSAGRS